MRKRRWLIFIAGLALMLALGFWQLPTLLKAVPSRYVARLPEPLQELGTRGDGVAILPTVAAPQPQAVADNSYS